MFLLQGENWELFRDGRRGIECEEVGASRAIDFEGVDMRFALIKGAGNLCKADGKAIRGPHVKNR